MKTVAVVLTLISLFVLAACAGPTPAPPVTSAAPSATVSDAATPAPSQASAGSPGAPTNIASTATKVPATGGTPAATPAPPTIVATSTANPTVAGGLIGLWKGNNNSFYLLNNDGTWNWDQDGQKVLTTPENQGRWWLEGDIFRIQDTAGTAPCPLAQVGSYQAMVTGDVLTLTAVADLCSVRIDQTAGNYARQPAGP